MSVIKRKDLITDEAVLWPKKYLDDLDKIIVASKKLGSSTAKKSLSELEKVERSFALATKRSVTEIIEKKAALNTLNSETRQAVKDVQNHENAYYKLSKKLNDARKAYKNLAAAGNTNTKSAKAQLAQIKKLDSQLKKIDNSVGQNQRSVGKYSNAIKGVTARFLGWGVAIAIVTKALSSGFKAVRDNSKANAELRGILNKTRKETIELRKEQLRLGGSTVFTATQVTKAQIELSRLGLSMERIIKLTPAILDGAVALGVDMSEAAELVAGQLNAFNLAASEGARITDVLVRSTQISAFNFERLKTSLSIVSPAAEAVGISFERMTAILSAAVDANIDASTAGTALRNIFIELAAQGLTWDEAMTQINTSTDRLSEANKLFGKRGSVVSTVIANNTLKINENEKALNNATGAAQKFAQAQKDNLAGDQLLWTSAWEGFFQQLNEGNSLISTFTRGTIQAFTSAITAMTRAIAGNSLETELWKDRVKDADLSLEQLGRLANKFADAQTKNLAIQNDTNNTLNTILEAEENVKIAQEQRLFILDLMKSKISELNEEEKKEVKVINDVTEAREKELIILKKLDSLVATFPPKLTKMQEGLLALTEQVFGKSTIDEDAKEYLDKIGDAIKKTGDLSKENRDREIKDAQILADKKQDILNKSFDVASELGNRFTSLRIEQIGQELTAIEFARNRELESAGDNERKKFEINKKFDEEKRKLQKKQVITERANALFQIALNTAIGITNALSKVLTAPLVPFIIAMGAIQAAAVIAAPIPQFDEGTERTPKDYIAGEKRPELRKSKGKWSLVDKPTLFENSPGDKIVSGKETDSILGTISDLTGENMLTAKNGILALMNNNINMSQKKDNNLAYVLKRNNDELIKTIKNKKEVGITVSDSGARVREKSGNIYVDRIDYYYKR